MYYHSVLNAISYHAVCPKLLLVWEMEQDIDWFTYVLQAKSLKNCEKRVIVHNSHTHPSYFLFQSFLGHFYDKELL